MTTIGVDFDGVIHANEQHMVDGQWHAVGWPRVTGGPLPGAIDALRQLLADYTVFVFTARHTSEALSHVASGPRTSG